MMQDADLGRGLVLFFRLAMGWTFLYAASHQIFDPGWSVAGFLSHTRTFNGIYAVFAAPPLAAVVSFLVGYGHLLIGLSLILGLLTRVSAAFGVLLMILYWTAHMDWPYIGDTNNFILDYHIVYAGVLLLLIQTRAGQTFGLDRWLAKQPLAQSCPQIRALIG